MCFTGRLIIWYEGNKRLLPWRDTEDPYRIWVSEVILQQTRVDQGLDYYHRFLERFPDVVALSSAPLEDVMKVWQGLGYYSRARHMHEAAKDICDRHNASFPSSYEELIRLKGIGDYSASAIASIAFNEPCPVVDGNVLRVVSRYFGIVQPVNNLALKKEIKEILAGLIDRERPGTFNQAVMELGALVCTPRRPLCTECPVSSDCYALKNSMTASLPLLEKARPKKIHYYHYLVLICREDNHWKTWIRKRTGKGIWRNLYDFPLIETEQDIPPEALMQSESYRELFNQAVPAVNSPVVEKARHMLTHKDLRVTFLILPVTDFQHPGFLKIALDDWHKYPVPRLIEIFLKKFASDRVYF